MRPAFGAAWNRFREVNVNVETVGKLLGGKVQHNIEFLKMPAPFV